MSFIDYVEINPSIKLEKGKEYPFIEMSSVDFYAREPQQIDIKEYSSGVKFQRGDTVISRIEPCLQNGKSFFVKNISEGFGSTEFLVFRPKDKKVNNEFLYYFLLTNGIRKIMINSMTGATGRQRVNNDIFKSLEISLPPIKKQERIANILSTYDDLIENNQKQIKLLEEAAMRLYKEWFVNLRFPGYETTKIVDGVPEGWVDCVLSDAVEFDPVIKLLKNNKRKNVPMAALNTSLMTVDEELISDTVLKTGAVFCNSDTLLARITPCLENGKTAFVNFLEEGKSAVGSTEFIVMRSKNLNPFMVYCLARSDNFRSQAINSMTGADGRQRVKIETLKNIKYLLPSKLIIDLCKEQMEPAFNKIKILNKQKHLLQEARDRLLPKLMSGEINVSEEYYA